jgi:hypothetical protein
MLLNGSLGKTLLIPTPGHIAPAPGAPAPELGDNARPLSLPPLNLIASLRVNPPTERMRDVHKLHITQSVPMLDENSALRPNMPQRDDDEGGKPKRLSFSPASSV